MKAVVLRKQGPPGNLQLEADFPLPKRKPGQLLLRVAAASVNPIDWKTREGKQVPGLFVALPKVLGGDLAGRVVEADVGSAFKPGDRVFGLGPGALFGNSHGCYAEFHAIDEGHVVAIPEGISDEEAAAVPLAGMTAYQALQPGFPLHGKRVLIHAGAGGVGSLGIQLAKAAGAHVTTTCSGRNMEFVKGLGADMAIDYTRERFEEVCKGQPFDVVVDCIGGDYEGRSFKVLKKRGVFSEILNSGAYDKYGALGGALAVTVSAVRRKLAAALRLGPSYNMMFVQPGAGKGLAYMAELMAAGKLKPIIDQVLPLADAAKAHEYMEKGHARGKVVLKVA